MLERIEVQINVQSGPIKVTAMEQLDTIDLRNAGIFEPWKILMGQKMLFARHVEPNPLWRDAQNLNL